MRKKNYQFYGKMVETRIRSENFNNLNCKFMLYFSIAFVSLELNKKECF